MGGVALACSRQVTAGTEISLELPGAGGAVSGTVVRADGGILAIEFRADDISRARVERAIQALGKMERVA